MHCRQRRRYYCTLRYIVNYLHINVIKLSVTKVKLNAWALAVRLVETSTVNYPILLTKTLELPRVYTEVNYIHLKIQKFTVRDMQET